MPGSIGMQGWFLEGYIDNSNTTRKLRIKHFPFLIGRNPGLGLTIDSTDVSRLHAEIFERQGELTIRDLNSTNGSFINHKPLKNEGILRNGDVLHIANVELRVTAKAIPQNLDGGATQLNIRGSADKLPVGWVEFEEMLHLERVSADFQAIMSNRDETLFAYEILGRGAHPKLPRAPIALFRRAEKVGCEIELSESLRYLGVKLAVETGSPLIFFMNIHPKELIDPARLLDSMQKLREAFPQPRLVLEIHEQAVTDLKVMRRVKNRLNAWRIGLAYDDFGAGQARILELVETPPEYLKFDIAFIRDINHAQTRKVMLDQLLLMAKRLNIKTLAEGVGKKQEAETCRALGFDLLQGFYYSLPSPGLEVKGIRDTE